MNKLYLDKLKTKTGYSGGKYENLVSKLFAYNAEKINRKVGHIQQQSWEKFNDTVRTNRERLVLPKIENVIPKRDVTVLKSAEKGRLITDTLKNDLSKKLNDILKEFPEQYTVRQKINQKLIKTMQAGFKDVFSGYTKKDKSIGIPPNIHAIAVTETRSYINQMKKSYSEGLKVNNPDAIISKEWRHNQTLSKHARKGHRELNGKKISIDSMFHVKIYKNKNGRDVFTGKTVMMSQPHDNNGGSDQVINCSCDIVYRAKKEKQ